MRGTISSRDENEAKQEYHSHLSSGISGMLGFAYPSAAIAGVGRNIPTDAALAASESHRLRVLPWECPESARALVEVGLTALMHAIANNLILISESNNR